MKAEAMWISTKYALPPDDRVVMTRIEDAQGIRNEQELKRKGKLWWTPDGKMYVYYAPTHWMHTEQAKE